MSLDVRVVALKEKHHDLEMRIEEETNRPLPDTVLIAGLKREKLRIKDEINTIQSR